MAFCNKEKQFIDSGHTTVDNKFIFNYLPDAADIRSSIYLFGLALSESDGDDNSCETIARKFNISCEDVISAYQYWEELGLVHIVNSATPRVIYLALADATALKDVKPSKYAKFTRDMQDVISGRMITINEYNEYYTFLENTTFEPAALVAVARYCVELQKNDINYRYILTVARNQLKKGATTLAHVSENLQSQQKYDTELQLIIKVMQLRSYSIHYYDRENYEKWIKDYGFSQEVILNTAKKCKMGGMTKLDNLLSQYYRNGAFSEKEIAHFEQEKTHLYELAKAINRTIGVYYQSLDTVIEEYVLKWLRKGYDDETLLAIAKYSFTSGIRTLNGLDNIIDKLYKKGVTNLTSLDAYLSVLSDTDKIIQTILYKCGLVRRTISSDRTLYRTWTEDWNMPLDVIYYAAELSAGASNPLTYLNRILSDYKQSGIVTVEQARAHNGRDTKTTTTTAATAYIGGRDMERRQYTDEEIGALFTALDETED